VATTKYLGIHFNEQLTWDAQWDHVQSKTNSVKFLIRRLKRMGFGTGILVNVYRSLVLSHFQYSAPVLGSTSAAAKNEMAKQQASFLDIIGISSEHAAERYHIQPISSFIDSTCVNILKRIVANREHPITEQIRRPTSEMKSSHAFPYRIPGKVSKSTAYNNSRRGAGASRTTRCPSR
jgi:hypothetical protein